MAKFNTLYTKGQIKAVTNYALSTDLDDKDVPTSFVELDGGAAACVITKFTPTKGKMYVITCTDVTTADPTFQASSGVTLDGTNDLATFDAVGETLVIFAISATTCIVVANPQSITIN